MKPIISVEGLGKSYTIRHEGQTRYKSLREEIFELPKRLFSQREQSQEEFWALRDMNFDIMPGDRVGIIGRNGAGKSTLLKLLSRITEPTAGRITLRGRVASLLEVGTGFHPELTGRENIFLNGAILGMSRGEVRRKFDEIVDFAGVEKFLDTPVKRYSSGMYVRLAFAVAAHLEPEILIVDEVLAVGDAEFQKKCLGKMEAVGKEGRTVLFVSHNTEMLRKLCTSAIVMAKGQICYEGNILSALNFYENAAEDSSNFDFDNHDSVKASITSFGPDIPHLKLGEKSVFQIGYVAHEEIFEPQISITFINEMGITVASFVSTFQETEFSSIGPGKGVVECSTDCINLMPGSYSIKLAFWVTGELIHEVRGTKTVSVVSDSRYTFYKYDQRRATTYIHSVWKNGG